MKIHGIGVDVVSVNRIRKTYDKFGQRFLNRVLHPTEKDKFIMKKKPMEFLASRWALKEAVYKAFNGWRVPFPDIYLEKPNKPVFSNVDTQLSINPNSFGVAPQLQFDGETKQLAELLNITESHVSLSHDGDICIAYVILHSCQSSKIAK